MKTRSQDIDHRDLDADDLRKIITALRLHPSNALCAKYQYYAVKGLAVAEGKLRYLREGYELTKFETFPLADLREALPIFNELVREFTESKKLKAKRFCSMITKGIKMAIDWLEWHEREAANQTARKFTRMNRIT